MSIQYMVMGFEPTAFGTLLKIIYYNLRCLLLMSPLFRIIIIFDQVLLLKK